MREFYETKLREMEVLLSKSEIESEKLSQELDKLEKGHSSEKDLAEKLRGKQEQVAQLRKKQAELTRLTNVASRNESQISKLRKEVTEMKQKKVDLQKQILNERKQHAMEVQKLKKETMQKERELNKAKMISDRRAVEAEKAKNMAKNRLEHLNQLKSKFKESEKRLRMQTLKKGVMSKAGFDPVMVGRRQSKKQGRNDANEHSVNFDTLRDHFDEKVADIGRKEALAEKLAQEWEEHLELSIQREELKMQDESSGNLLAIDSKISYKEDRIRQLAARLGRRQNDAEQNDNAHDNETFLFDRKFRKIIGNTNSETSTKAAVQVLFGMVVRERRRIATLARTASLLDERVQDAEAASVAKDEAFRSYVNEQRVEAVNLAQHQQEHILSLMEMVKEEPSQGSLDGAGNVENVSQATSSGNSKLLVLANERIAVLERQLYESQLERENFSNYREKKEKDRSLLDTKTEECKQLEEEVSSLKTALRRVREDISQLNGEPEQTTPELEFFSQKQTLLTAIERALHPQNGSPRRKAKSHNSTDEVGSKRSFDLEYNSSDGEEVPDWAEDIMKDLATIAEGKMPSVLRDSADIINAEAKLENLDVFDRLTNPASFTGKQKKHFSERRVVKKSPKPKADENKKKKTLDVQITESITEAIEPPESEDKRSVFERLMSPSNATGVQKLRLQDQEREKQSRSESEMNEEVDSNSAGEQFDGQNIVGVVERLNKTTNRAYALQQQVNRAEEMLDNVLEKQPDEEASSEADDVPVAGTSQRVQEYTQQNVFERLQKTTTRAYKVKQNVALAEKHLDIVLEKGPLSDFSNLQSSTLSKSETMETGSVCSSHSAGTHKSTRSSVSGHSTNTTKTTRKPKLPPKEYGSVFERLHHTTTVAKKTRTNNPNQD